jgi:hypothetical protein
MKPGRNTTRALFTLLILVSILFLSASYYDYTSSGKRPTVLAEEATVPFEERQEIAPSSGGPTVITTQPTPSASASGRRTGGKIVAFAPDGRLLYYNDSAGSYWDVDPIPNESRTVAYVASYELSDSVCEGGRCYLNVIEVANLTTGEVDRIYRGVSTGFRWHDVDRIEHDRYAVADIAADRVFIVNTTTDMIRWEWQAESDIALDTGGKIGADWTHLNDVEVLDSGLLMVSLRNQDRVVFINRSTGITENLTLGSEDQYDILREQHNPDFIPASNGGPAVLVADSENGRIVEYQRRNGKWVETWRWSASYIAWPRDADRLPNGNTLVTASNGDRVLEVNQSNQVVWSYPIDNPYEAERIGTGLESTNGSSARQLGLESSEVVGKSDQRGYVPIELKEFIKGLFPTLVYNAVLFILPPWMNFIHAVSLSLLIGSTVLWGVVELHWRYSVNARLHRPLSISFNKK